jgi:hypothetical protein
MIKMEISEEEKTLISMLNIVDTYIEDTKVTKVIFSMEDAKVLYDLIKRQQRKLKEVEDYVTSYDFFHLLCTPSTPEKRKQYFTAHDKLLAILDGDDKDE